MPTKLTDDFTRELLQLNDVAFVASSTWRPLAEEVLRLRADNERFVWNLAGCSTISISDKPLDYDKNMALPALEDVNKLAERYVKANEEVLRLRRLARLVLDEVTGPGSSDITERDIQELREALRDGD